MMEKNFSMPSSSQLLSCCESSRLFLVVKSAVCCGAVFALAMYGYRQYQEARLVGILPQSAPMISLHASGEATIARNIATVDVGMTIQAETPSAAQEKVNVFMKSFTEAVKNLGITDGDLATSSYSVYPQYQYTDGQSEIVGYEATQMLTVKMRDADKVNEVLRQASALGATNVGSLRFEAEDRTEAENEARSEAIARARLQAEAIARDLGQSLGDVQSYSESSSGGMYPVYASFDMYAKDSSVPEATAPDIAMGEDKVVIDVYVGYGLK